MCVNEAMVEEDRPWVRCKIPGCGWEMKRSELLAQLKAIPRKKWEAYVASILVEHLKTHFRHNKSVLLGIAQMGRKGFDKFLEVDWEWLKKL